MSLSGALTASELGSKRIQMTEFYSLSIETLITICEAFIHMMIMTRMSDQHWSAIKTLNTRSTHYRSNSV